MLQSRSGRSGKKEKSFTLAGIRTPALPARSLVISLPLRKAKFNRVY
jgi:hypothetical protein